jgi:peptidyl-prolyl cis-trans isomerase SurA
MNKTKFAVTAALAVLGLVVMPPVASAQAQNPPAQNPPQNPFSNPPQKPPETAMAKAVKPASRVIEEIIARVNNEIITRTDYETALQALRREMEEDCQEASRKDPALCTPDKFKEALAQRQKDVLRDLIDNSLLVQRAKDMGINVETDLIKQLDSIRVQNNLPDMEALERAVTQAGIVWEEYKNNFRNRLLTDQIIYREIQPQIMSKISDEDLKKYYEEHKNEFHRPAQVVLSEIFVGTDGKPEAELPALEQKAKTLHTRVKNGEDFNELAKRFSDGTTAKQGGSLGTFEPSQLSKEIADQVFKMKRGEFTDVIQTRTGYLILKVEQRYEQGIQPLEKVEMEIRQQLYYKDLQPVAREYLTRLRGESYVMIKAGYVDSAGVSTAPIQEVQPAPPEDKDAKKKKKKDGHSGSL